MKTRKQRRRREESTYSLLMRSRDVKREYFEMIVYALVVVSAVAAIVQFATQSDPLPLTALPA
jgi:hypothetical protein